MYLHDWFMSGGLISWMLSFAAGCQPITAPQTSSTPVAVAEETPVATLANENAAERPAPALLSEQELAEGWIALFDGQTLFGWKPNSEANWRVENGAIVVDSGPPGLLLTTAQFSDYVLKCEFRSPAATNSGIFLHVPFKPTDPGKDCYELNIRAPIIRFQRAASSNASKRNGNFVSDDWQAFEVTVHGEIIKVAINGKQVLEYTDPQPLRRGHIGLQLNQGQVAFRNIKLKPLTMTNLFNGKDFEGWNQYPDMPSKFTVTKEGWINVKNGRGQLETEKSYGDFELQLECISHAKNLNSGVFFRSIPGEQMNGYECQIHNGFKDGDRTKPVDCGTGGIFRRKDARLVVANDLEWFHLTLVADGNHMAAWVNGYQVSDWTDDRQPHKKPADGPPR